MIPNSFYSIHIEQGGNRVSFTQGNYLPSNLMTIINNKFHILYINLTQELRKYNLVYIYLLLEHLVDDKMFTNSIITINDDDDDH